ncbi:MAG: heparinase II/III family protein [Anaerolineaceae bacterium]|nr:heparinase II/III family protein [Anaerolineaceae bacterium]
MNKLYLAFKAVQELGFQKILYFALYKLGLRSGHYFRATPSPDKSIDSQPADLSPFVNELVSLIPAKTENLLKQAQDICNGKARLFGTEPQALNLTPTPPLSHWTAYETGHAHWKPDDIKLIWEPARFSWAFTLARAYQLDPNEAYPQAFWHYFEIFSQANPPYLGPNWMSGQEAALRMLAFIFCDIAFHDSPSSTPDRRTLLTHSIVDHAERIPPTLIYARAQNNNHLISEAVGLFTASIYLPDHPHASKWHRFGWKWFNWAIQHQIDPVGTYIQHSTNYHRLMLQLSIWMATLTNLSGIAPLPDRSLQLLFAATNWLWALTDPQSGHIPNLGANDGANFLPLNGVPYEDYRPTLEAAKKAFPLINQPQPQADDMLRLENGQSHAFLRVAHFKDRPSHADQLRVDLWWGAENVTLDAGTYSYNASTPWTNALSTSRVHNTVTLDQIDQMTPVSRFLWLNWAQSEVLEIIQDESDLITGVTAQHDGYRHYGIIHRRSVTAPGLNEWIVDDVLLIQNKRKKLPTLANLSWLLPDLPWDISQNTLTLNSSQGTIHITIQGSKTFALVRGGECVFGDLLPDPFMGWFSPAYGVKVPALQLIASAPISTRTFFTSTFQFEG